MKVETPLLVPVLAALPVCACMAILGLPSVGHGYATAFRTLYFSACLAWLAPLALLQRAGWRRAWHWLPTALLLLVAISRAFNRSNCSHEWTATAKSISRIARPVSIP